MLYFMDKAEELEGKTVAFTHMAKFADRILIATTDGGILGVSHTIQDDDEAETIVYKKHQMEQYIFDNRYLLGELGQRGIITNEDIKDYNERKLKAIQDIVKKSKEEKEKSERELYEKLKEKYKE